MDGLETTGLFSGAVLVLGRVLGETRGKHVKLGQAGISFIVERYQVATEFH